MSAEEHIKVQGIVATVLPNMMYRVKLDNGHEVLGYPAGQLRKRSVRLTVGDRVEAELSPYDLTKARITARLS